MMALGDCIHRYSYSMVSKYDKIYLWGTDGKAASITRCQCHIANR